MNTTLPKQSNKPPKHEKKHGSHPDLSSTVNKPDSYDFGMQDWKKDVKEMNRLW